MFFLCRLMDRKRFFYANSFNWSLTSPVILDTHAAVEPSWSRNLTEIVVYKYSTHCFSLDFGSECLQRRKKSLSVFVLDSKRKTEQSLWNTLFIYRRVLFVTFLLLCQYCCPFSGMHQYWQLWCYNLVTGNTPQKIFFPLFLEMKIRASWGYVLNSKSATREPVWLKFGQLTVR